jgi:hypothetical protein
LFNRPAIGEITRLARWALISESGISGGADCARLEGNQHSWPLAALASRNPISTSHGVDDPLRAATTFAKHAEMRQVFTETIRGDLS